MIIREIVGVIILIGPLVFTLISIFLTFLHTGYKDFVKKPSYRISRQKLLIIILISVIIMLAILYIKIPFLENVRVPVKISTGTSGVVIRPEANFSLYWDSNGIEEVTHVSWGKIVPGNVSYNTVYVKNDSNRSIYCQLTWNETSWAPQEALKYFNITWDFGIEPLQPNHTRKVTLQLHLSPYMYDIEEFSFDVLFIGMIQPFPDNK